MRVWGSRGLGFEVQGFALVCSKCLDRVSGSFANIKMIRNPEDYIGYLGFYVNVSVKNAKD